MLEMGYISNRSKNHICCDNNRRQISIYKKIWGVVVVPPEKTDNQKDARTMVPVVPMVVIN
ncbi:hypothetical protein GCM10022259_41200 [Aquimarina mytili]